MSYEKPRMDLNDTLIDVVYKFSEGNPGAVNVLMQLVTEAGKIDVDDAFGGLGAIMELDNLDVYGSNIWILYKDVCKCNLVDMVGLLRSVQLGISRAESVKGYIAYRGTNLSSETLACVMSSVRARLPNFGK